MFISKIELATQTQKLLEDNEVVTQVPLAAA